MKVGNCSTDIYKCETMFHKEKIYSKCVIVYKIGIIQ